MSKTLGQQAWELFYDGSPRWDEQSNSYQDRWIAFAAEFRGLVLAELSPGLRMVMERLEQHREAKRTPGQVAADAYREAFCKTGGDLQLAFSAAAAAVLEHAKAVKEKP